MILVKRKLLPYLLGLFLVLGLNNNISSQSFRIMLDEDYSDWESISPLYGDDTGDASGIDFQTLKATNYNGYLFFYLKIGSEINLQDNNSITLYLDTDNDPSTGLPVKGIGAELEYTFGARSGKFWDGNSSYTISHADIGLVSIPTVTSSVFEIMIDTTAVINGKKLFTGTEIKIAFVDKITGGDEIPNGNVEPIFVFASKEPQIEINYSIEKLNDDWIRVISYNSERDNLFDPTLKESYSRIFKALDPTIIGFQELYDHTAQQAAALIEEFLPTSEGEQWYSAKQGSDIIVVSKYPIEQSFFIEGNGAFLINLQERYGEDLLFVDAHTPCCAKNDGRQKEIDAFMAFIRDAKEEGGELTLENKTPIIIVGDMNMVGYKQQQTTLITGDIINTSIYGEKFLPDWDSTYLMDSKSPATHMPATFTWYDMGSSFAPGRLDYVVFTNSVIKLKNNFVLFTNALPEDSLTKYNLLYNDATRASDHLPHIVDFDFNTVVSVERFSEEAIPTNFELYQNYPNPFNPSTTIKYQISSSSVMLNSIQHLDDKVNVSLKVFDILGREIATLVNEQQQPGVYQVQFNADEFPSGIYYYQLRAGSFQQSKKMIILK
ncbi:hypothetical protein MNBD_IGNAVI01-978 [hydrothermal vent metagenome]|uniref:Endonuclease/exonuclease/phosphatase domain-containing protein n=1 Tax=hydrothermal vent metagenome TaxID=652676 RepID=A0A3B1CZW6_9ZZZZ